VGLLTQSYLTPNSLFYIRHHHPVPNLSEEQIKDYHLTIDLSALPGTAPTSNKLFRISLDELKAMPKLEYNATLQCSGNRRSGFNAIERTSGTNWGQGAISTAKFGGVRLIDVMRKAGVHNFIAIQEEDGIHHVRFHSLDGMSASVDIEKALGPYGDVLICYEMNGEPLPRDHGFPLRVIVPGYAAVRNVKWLERIELAATEAEGPWQRGLNYKILPPNVFDVNNIDVSQMPSVAEMSLYSGITEMKRISKTHMLPGDRVTLHVKGWAWAGGGRKVVRVDVTGDDGKSWVTANITEGANQRHRRAWAWVFWECHVPTVVGEDGIAQVASKAVDSSFNVQPEKANHEWNVRGLMNNSWYKSQARVIQAKRHTLGIVDLSQMDDEEESA
jgi:sulfite oxidase